VCGRVVLTEEGCETLSLVLLYRLQLLVQVVDRVLCQPMK
jgi:hypothetical protein